MEQLEQFLIEFIPPGIAPYIFAVQFSFACIGATLILLNDLRSRDKKSTRSPEKFNLVFFLWDNLPRVALGAFSMWALIYFADMFLPDQSSNQMRYLVSMLIGAFSDLIFSRVIKYAKTTVVDYMNRIFTKKS